MQCPKCNKEFDEWFSKDKGQKFPFKSCLDCRQKAKESRDEGQQTFSGGSGEILALLREIRDIVKGDTITKEKPTGEPPEPSIPYNELKDEDGKDIPF